MNYIIALYDIDQFIKWLHDSYSHTYVFLDKKVKLTIHDLLRLKKFFETLNKEKFHRFGTFKYYSFKRKMYIIVDALDYKSRIRLNISRLLVENQK